MNRFLLRLMLVLTLVVGGGSMVLLVYFLSAGPPIRVTLVRTDGGRLAIDALLSLLFFVQHSGMVRRGAKERMARHVSAAVIPALYSIASGVALVILVLFWQPTGDLLYRLEGPVRWLPTLLSLAAAAGFAWGVISLRGFDPFGTVPLRTALRGSAPATSDFVLRGPYRLVRHPLYLFVLILIWSAPRLATDQLLFNVLWTVWIVLATWLEERDLLREFGPSYRQYQQAVPMLLPVPRVLRRRRSAS